MMGFQPITNQPSDWSTKADARAPQHRWRKADKMVATEETRGRMGAPLLGDANSDPPARFPDAIKLSFKTYSSPPPAGGQDDPASRPGISSQRTSSNHPMLS